MAVLSSVCKVQEKLLFLQTDVAKICMVYGKNEFLDFLFTTLINELIKCNNDELNVCN